MKLTLPQQDIYFEQLLYPNEPIYNIGAKIEIKGHINIDAFQKAYHELINQHDAYRTRLVKDQDNIRLKIVDIHDSQLGFVDFSDSQTACETANSYMQEEFSKPFNLFGESLLHVFTLVKVNDGFYYLFSVYHHIITDGWGTSLMFQRLVQNYNEIFEFGSVQTEYPFTYKDFIEDDAIYTESESFMEDKAYWKDRYKVLPENLFDKIQDSGRANKSSRKELIIKRATYNQLSQLADSYNCTTFHLILALMYTYFGRKHENNDFAIGLPVLNRSKSKYKKTVGLFMGISPLRMELDFDATVEQLTKDLKSQLRNDYRHQRFPLGKLIQELQLFQEKERLFNITLSYEKQNYSNDFQNTVTEVIPLSHQSERVALALYIREFDETKDVKIDFDYNLNYFDNSGISNIVNHFDALIHDVIKSPEKKLRELNYLSEDELNQILINFNSTEVIYPKEKTVVNLFQDQALKTPGKEALKDENRSYSYSELDTLSSQIAEQLITIYGKKDKSPIAVLLERSANLVVVLLGILKAGRPYIPLDPAFPKDRLRYIIENSQSKVLFTQKDYDLDNLEEVAVLELENILEGIDDFKGVIAKTISPEDTAYIIYTSGSTGNPKGVEIGHQSLVNFLTSIQESPGVDANDLFFSVTTYSFDISILEFFVPLISGAVLYVADKNILADPGLTIKKIEEIKPTIIQATPSFYQMLFNADWQGDKGLKILCGGDLLSEALADNLINKSLEVWNMYGPTETTIWSSIKKLESPEDASNIGKPIHNTQFYILDRYLNPMPLKTAGAIYIAGDGLAKGYYKNEVLTKEKFINNPFAKGSLLYETGDLGKWNEKGEIDFLGRNDNQVKIRGYRIELGDIETQLNQISGIKAAVVIAKKEDNQEAFLVAYVLKSEEEIDLEEIMIHLQMSLPYYMIPNVIIPLDEFPLTPNQKIDRKNLVQRNIIHTKVDFKNADSKFEKSLLKYWKEVLNRDDISVNDNFFALGGHSLNAVRLTGLIAKHLLFEITLKTIFDYPTIELLAEYLERLTPTQTVVIPLQDHKEFYELTPTQYNIWLASQEENSSIAYNMFMAYKIEGSIDVDKLEKTISKIVSKYEILRTNFIEINGVPYQKTNLHNDIQVPIPVIEVQEEETDKIIYQLNNTAFNFQKDSLIRVYLLQETDQTILLFCTHHIIMDGLSLEIFVNEFIKNYNESSFLVALPDKDQLAFQFKDYSEWFNKTIHLNEAKNESFWNGYLENYLPKDTFYKDFNPKHNHQKVSGYSFEITPEVTLALKDLAIQAEITFYGVLISALNVLVYKESNHTDICIGTVNSGRNISGLNNQIGMFVKTLILRTQISSDIAFTDLLQQTQNNLLEINEYQDIPFDKIPKAIFDVLFVYQNPEFTFDEITLIDNLKLTSYSVESKFSRMPIVFNLFESENKLKGNIEYNPAFFEEETIELIVEKYSKILIGIIENATVKIDSIDARSETEKNTAFDFEFNF
ncbi:non-ribosomal peptide synthetase [Flavobacterium sp. MC2016-06]|jgi:amino acid adenylation domain-containing protein|uniref:non-ribosomal peptide synthetase n=1 Tax=Flavobacterium sp. MC2016-06 TaxID=2676308 RepID=UPI0012BB02A7|nr:non-ribosomal peptide synthetase [Flavobacterium sp. MC2016-06]MBU3861553.1 amino acid adenylation domain-containing protein [Flavobacterium sp. MC2016-06]